VDGYAMRDFAADAIAFMDAMGLDRATVVGHSMGSFIAQQVALSAPERVERLVLIGAGPSVHAVEGLSELEQAVETLGDPVPEAFVREFQASTFHQPVPSAYMDRVVAESRKVPGHVCRKTLAGMLGSSLPAHLPIGVPTLIVWGEEDLYFRRASQETLLALLPQATLEVYPETGHATHWERPEWFARDLAAFIARTTPQ
jgi:pimeloyl-ACP methyl ester carboxylesterase